MTTDQYNAQLQAADFFNKTARKLLTVGGTLHAETLIASMARMSGSLMYRSFDIDQNIKPGTAVLSEQANIYGPSLMNLMLGTLQHLGDQVAVDSLNQEYISSRFSQLSFQESHDRLAAFFLKYCEVASLSFRDAAFAAAMGTAILVHDCREVLSVDKGGAIAVYGFVEGTKTAPFPVPGGESTASPAPSEPRKPWYRLW